MAGPFIQQSGHFNQQDARMSTATFDDYAQQWAARLEAGEARRCGSLDTARQRIARRLGCSPGTLETLRRGRMKKVCAALYARCQALVIRELEQQIQALEHELHVARQSGLPVGSDEIFQAETHLAQARDLVASMAARERG